MALSIARGDRVLTPIAPAESDFATELPCRGVGKAPP